MVKPLHTVIILITQNCKVIVYVCIFSLLVNMNMNIVNISSKSFTIRLQMKVNVYFTRMCCKKYFISIQIAFADTRDLKF